MCVGRYNILEDEYLKWEMFMLDCFTVVKMSI
jgi:hypothetical protein